MKAALFSITSLFLFVLHIATLNIGKRTATSPFATARSTLLSSASLQTLLWYTVSAWWYCEAYIWVSAQSGGLSWVTRGDLSSADRLNERPIYARALFLMLAITQSALHLYQDRSALSIPTSGPPTPQDNDQRTHPIPSIQVQIQNMLPDTLTRCLTATTATSLAAPFIYTFLLRQPLWQLHLLMAKPFFSLSRADAYASGIPALYPPFLVRVFFAGLLLTVTWELSSLLFVTYLRQEPLKKGVPLSAGSKDPNGTLLNGLRAKRDVVKTFAFWELAIIAQQQPDRRRAIFGDIDRAYGSVWSQMLQEALAVIRTIDSRIVGPQSTSSQPPPAQPQQGQGLPKLFPESNSGSIFMNAQPSTSGAQRLEAIASSGFSKLGTAHDPWQPPVDEAKRQLLEYAKPANADDMPSQSLLEQWLIRLQRSPVGWFFTTTKAGRINATVLGTTHSNAALLVDAVESVTKMLVASLTEDTYGKAVAGVPETVKALTTTINLVEQYVQNNGQGLRGGIEEVEVVIARLKAGLRELLSAFQMYLSDVGLGIDELNQAKSAAEQRPLLGEQKNKGSEAQDNSDDSRRQLSSSSNNRQQSNDNSKRTEQRQKNGTASKRREGQRQDRRQQSSLRDWNSTDNRAGQRREMEMVR